jgi:hypothetical protein
MESDSGTASNPEDRGSIDSSETYAKYGITNVPKTTVTTVIGQVNTHFHFVMRPDSYSCCLLVCESLGFLFSILLSYFPFLLLLLPNTG